VPLVALLGAFAVLAPIAMSDPSPAGAAQRTSGIPAPLMWSRSFADPTVVESRVGYVGAATAPNLNIGRAQADAGPWNVIATPALTRRPGWAASAELWAPDIQRAPGGWLMYYAAPIAGADENSRCIGVAYSKKSFGPFTPIGEYGLLADCNSAALVSRDGSIDWLCLPRYDADAIFARILDPDAGHWLGFGDVDKLEAPAGTVALYLIRGLWRDAPERWDPFQRAALSSRWVANPKRTSAHATQAPTSGSTSTATPSALSRTAGSPSSTTPR